MGALPKALRFALPALLAGAIAVALAASATTATAACGGTETAKPTKQVNPHGRPPLILGDSVMLLALKKLAAEGYAANAHGCRQFIEGTDMLARKRKHNRLPHLVVLALGSNGPVTAGNISDALHATPKNRVLGLVTPRGTVAGDGAKVMRAVARKHKHRIVLLDWVRFSSGHKDWFGPDNLHLTYAGAAHYAKFLGKAVRFARAGKFPNGTTFPR